MKKTLLLFVAIMLSVAAIPNPIPLQSQDVGTVGLPHKSPTILPTVDYADGILSIQSSILLSDVTVIIRDEEGTVLYSYYINSVSGTCSFYLPASILDEMYSVELLYGDLHLIGFF